MIYKWPIRICDEAKHGISMIEYIVNGVVTQLQNFTLAEARCHGFNSDGSIHDCGLIVLDPDFLLCLGLVRIEYGLPIRMESWTRCRKHNIDIGGSSTSKHPLGRAGDLMAVSGGDRLRLWRICDKIFPYRIHYTNSIHCDVRFKN